MSEHDRKLQYRQQIHHGEMMEQLPGRHNLHQILSSAPCSLQERSAQILNERPSQVLLQAKTTAAKRKHVCCMWHNSMEAGLARSVFIKLHNHFNRAVLQIISLPPSLSLPFSAQLVESSLSFSSRFILCMCLVLLFRRGQYDIQIRRTLLDFISL